MAKSLQQTISNYQTRASGAQQAFSDGVTNTQVDVVGRAIAAQPALLAGFNNAVNSGYWAARLSAVGTAGWKQATKDKAANYGVGIAAGLPRYTSAMQTWLPIIEQAAQQAKSMDGSSLGARLARANYFATTLYNRKRGQ